MHKIFISYSRADYDKVMILRNEIEQLLGVGSCWVDLDGIESDQQFVDVIIDAIDKADIFLFMYSQHSDSSEWTRKEINYAHSEKKRIVFVKLENVQLSKYFRFQFGEHDIIDLQDKKQKEKLLKNLSKWCNVRYHSSDENVNSSAQEGGGSKREKVKSSLSRLLNRSEEYIQRLKEKRDFENNLRLAAQGVAEAQYNLGFCYEYGKGVTKNVAEADKWYRKAAELGDAVAQYNLGLCYYLGNRVTKNYAEAVKWFRKAAMQGNVEAALKLYECYDYGHGVVKSDAEAMKWLHEAAEHGSVKAQNDLGDYYYLGLVVAKNHLKAAMCYYRAALRGYAKSQYNLGCCYARGEGVIQNHEEAVKWWRKAAAQGYEPAITALNAEGE